MRVRDQLHSQRDAPYRGNSWTWFWHEPEWTFAVVICHWAKMHVHWMLPWNLLMDNVERLFYMFLCSRFLCLQQRGSTKSGQKKDCITNNSLSPKTVTDGMGGGGSKSSCPNSKPVDDKLSPGYPRNVAGICRTPRGLRKAYLSFSVPTKVWWSSKPWQRKHVGVDIYNPKAQMFLAPGEFRTLVW